MGESDKKGKKSVVVKAVGEKEEMQPIILINEETIQNKIYMIRGQKVMLDFDLAEIYGYETKRFNEQIKNNIERFDEDFRFKLTKEEFENLRSKISTSSWGGSRYLPYAFTEQGIYMLMTVLKGELAIKQSKALIRTFKAMKDYITNNQGLMNQRDFLQLSLVVAEHSKDISEIKTSLNTIDNRVAEVVDRLGDVVMKSDLAGVMNIFGEPEFRNEYVLWDGQPFQADIAYEAIYQKAENKLYVIDNYIGIKTLALLKNSHPDVQIILFSDNVGKGLHSIEFEDFRRQYPECKIELRQTGKRYHDRYIILDYGTDKEKIFHCGPSSKDGGARIGSIVEIREKDAYHKMIDELCEAKELELY